MFVSTRQRWMIESMMIYGVRSYACIGSRPPDDERSAIPPDKRHGYMHRQLHEMIMDGSSQFWQLVTNGLRVLWCLSQSSPPIASKSYQRLILLLLLTSIEPFKVFTDTSMNQVASDNVHHGLRISWTDFDRPWGLRELPRRANWPHELAIVLIIFVIQAASFLYRSIMHRSSATLWQWLWLSQGRDFGFCSKLYSSAPLMFIKLDEGEDSSLIRILPELPGCLALSLLQTTLHIRGNRSQLNWGYRIIHFLQMKV